MAEPLPELVVPDAPSLRKWLVENHDRSRGVLLALHKKGGNVTSLTWDKAVDEGICFGWIDGQAGRRDEGSYTVRFTPRTKRSRWSKINTERVARLEAEGRVTDAGNAAVQAAKDDGRWEAAYAGPATAETPQDLLEAIAADVEAQRMFDVLTSQNRFAMIGRLGDIKTEETRKRRIAEFVAMLARHETLYPQRRKPSE